MKKSLITFIGASALLLTGFPGVQAQTLNVDLGNVIYTYPASETGIIEFESGNALNLEGKTYPLGDIKRMFVTEDVAEEDVVLIIYSEDNAEVYIPQTLMSLVGATVNGGHVTIDQDSDVNDEITYRLSGTSSDGSLTLNGSYKCSLELTGLQLTNPSGPALDIQNGKRIAVRVAEDTFNSLADGKGGDWKGSIVCKGHLEFKQKGTLEITGNTANGIYSKEYIELKNTKLTIKSAVKDGINCAQYFMMESGTLTIANVGDDGIQLEFKDATAVDDEEDTGEITIKGGKADISVSSDAVKGLKTEGDFIMTGGTLTVTNSGDGLWDEAKLKTKAASCIAADANILIEGGTLNLTATGGGGKGINADGNLTINDGEITISTSGGTVAYVNGQLNQNYTGDTERLNSDYKSSAKGIKVEGNIDIEDGTINVRCSGNGAEGIESKSVLTLSGGDITVRAYDDGTNSSSDTYIKGGNLDIMSIGNGDGVDANGNIYVSGGRMMIYGGRQPEQGFDAGDGYQIYFTGGEILAVGGGNSVPSSSQSTQAYLELSETVNAGDKITVSNGSEIIVEFTVAEDYNPQGNGGPRLPFMRPEPKDMPPMKAPGGGGFGGMGPGLVISAPSMVSGTNYSVTIGSASYNATAK